MKASKTMRKSRLGLESVPLKTRTERFGKSKCREIGWPNFSMSNQPLYAFACVSARRKPFVKLRAFLESGRDMALGTSRSTRTEISCLVRLGLRTVRLPFVLPNVMILTLVVLDLKEVHFAGEIMTVIEHGNVSQLSIARFTQERGAASSFHKVMSTMETVLRSRNILVLDERKKGMMIKTLKG